MKNIVRFILDQDKIMIAIGLSFAALAGMIEHDSLRCLIIPALLALTVSFLVLCTRIVSEYEKNL
jgi:hypothetical protein